MSEFDNLEGLMDIKVLMQGAWESYRLNNCDRLPAAVEGQVNHAFYAGAYAAMQFLAKEYKEETVNGASNEVRPCRTGD